MIGFSENDNCPVIEQRLRTGLAFTQSRRHWLAEEEIPTEMDTCTKFPETSMACQCLTKKER
jgi:hypothetical protein